MARSSKVEVHFANGMHTHAIKWPGCDPLDSTIRSIFFRNIGSIEVG